MDGRFAASHHDSLDHPFPLVEVRENLFLINLVTVALDQGGVMAVGTTEIASLDKHRRGEQAWKVDQVESLKTTELHAD